MDLGMVDAILRGRRYRRVLELAEKLYDRMAERVVGDP